MSQYDAIILYYWICIIIAFINYAIFLIMNKRQNPFVTSVFAIVAVANVGYLSLALSDTLSKAILANNITYVGGCFFPLCAFMIGADLCGVRISKWVRIPLGVFALVTLIMVFSIGHSPLYYETVAITKPYGIAHLEKTYGPLHNVYIALIVIYLVAIFVLLAIAFVRKNLGSWKIMTLFVIMLLLSFFGYVVGRAFPGIPVELVPVGYLAAEGFLLAIYRRIDMYDMTTNVMYAIEKMEEYAYIVLDGKRNYLGSNDLAKQFFPGLLKQKVDYPLNDQLDPQIAELIPRLSEIENGEKLRLTSITAGDRIFRAELSELRSDRRTFYSGYLIELFDVTSERHFISSIQDQNEKLKAAEEDAVRANHAKDSFLASMSHEIRTPINTILGMNELIGREAKDKDIVKYSKDIENAGRMLLSLVNDILDFSKIGSGKFELSFVNYQTASLLNDSLTILKQRAQGKNLELVADIDHTLPAGLYGDDVRIKQIIVNLLTNAVKYTNEGRITFSAEGIWKGLNKLMLLITVKDTGRGIKPEDKEKIFEGFERTDDMKNRHIEGTGLGLAITKSLCEEMGGTINVDSVFGEGSTFTVRIPQRVTDETPIGDMSSMLSGAGQKISEYREAFRAPDAELLVVDDNEMNISVFTGLLKQTGVQIDSASGGSEGFVLSRKKKYDIIFMDHMMPPPDGIETFEMIRADNDNPNKETPVIALTANAISGAAEMYLEKGFSDYLSKPIDSKKLERMIEKLLPEEKVIRIGS